jgi:1-deoxy-D-xylulose-5-phosphate synthase
VALQKLPVVFCMDRAGLSGDDGPTHHGLFDISYLRGIPEMVLMAPKDEDELADMMATSLTIDGPSAIRYPRGAVANVQCKAEPQAIPVGKAEVLSDGSDVAILGLGPMTAYARELGQRLEKDGFSVAVINPRFVKPIDREMLASYARRVAAFVTFEDHVKMGGFGSAVIEALQEIGIAIPVVRIGWPDQFIEHGKIESLRAKYGLTVDAAYTQVLPLLHARKRRTLVAS